MEGVETRHIVVKALGEEYSKIYMAMYRSYLAGFFMGQQDGIQIILEMMENT